MYVPVGYFLKVCVFGLITQSLMPVVEDRNSTFWFLNITISVVVPFSVVLSDLFALFLIWSYHEKSGLFFYSFSVFYSLI